MRVVCASVLSLCAASALAQPQWQPFGSAPGHVRDFVIHSSELYAAGAIPANTDMPTFTGGFVSRWTGNAWQPVGGNVGSTSFGLYTIESFQGALHAGSALTTTSSSLLRWDGSAWQSLPSPGGTIRDLRAFDGALWASGFFEVSRDGRTLQVAYVRRWNGQTWDTPGGTFTVDVQALTYLPPAIPLEVIDGQLHVGGDRFLRRWDGAAWQDLPAPPDFVASIAQHDGELYIGAFPLATNLPLSSTALRRLVNGQWTRAALVSSSGQIRDLVSYSGELIALGNSIGGPTSLPLSGDTPTSLSNTLRWCPGPRGMGQGLNNRVLTGIEFNGQLIVGGEFTADGLQQPLGYVASYTAGADPVFVLQPADMPPACSAADITTINAQARVQSDPVAFAYNDATGAFVLLSSTTSTPTLRPRWTPLLRDRGSWRFIITDDHGSTASRDFSVPIYDIDFNNNFVFPEDQDVIDFLSVFSGGPCSTSAPFGCDSIDINADGVFPDDQDVIDFFITLAGGNCP
jgi:hypothetical protein